MTTNPLPTPAANNAAIHRITPQDPPQFPCWAYRTGGWFWFQQYGAKPSLLAFTHWSPDAPTAPTQTPSAMDPLTEAADKAGVYDRTTTPRTDAMSNSGHAHYMMGDLARQIETELAACRVTLEAELQASAGNEQVVEGLRGELAARDAEIADLRDQAKYSDESDALRRHVERDLAAAQSAANDAREYAARMQRERDDARACIAKMQEALRMVADNTTAHDGTSVQALAMFTTSEVERIEAAYALTPDNVRDEFRASSHMQNLKIIEQSAQLAARDAELKRMREYLDDIQLRIGEDFKDSHREDGSFDFRKSLLDSISAIQQDRDTLRAEVAELTTQLSGLVHDNERLRAVAQQLDSDYAACREAFESKLRENTILTKENADLRAVAYPTATAMDHKEART